MAFIALATRTRTGFALSSSFLGSYPIFPHHHHPFLSLLTERHHLIMRFGFDLYLIKGSIAFGERVNTEAKNEDENGKIRLEDIESTEKKPEEKVHTIAWLFLAAAIIYGGFKIIPRLL